ncbi:MAG: tryptophan synthase subunit alpha, partial [Acidobacteriota bacterium]|nr:tryptophan synthase subunit alpha [Acidobacteriota bacterium]
LRFGLNDLARAAAEHGIDGCLLTDVSVEEAETYVDAMRAQSLDTVFLAAPTSTGERRKLVAKYSTGFVYLVSRTGVTGERESFSDAAGVLVSDMRKVTDLPLAIGFGISTAKHVRAAGSIADAVVVGSAIVRTIEENASSPDLEQRLERFAKELASGLPSKK